MRIAYGGIRHESNAFSDILMTLDRFRESGSKYGDRFPRGVRTDRKANHRSRCIGIDRRGYLDSLLSQNSPAHSPA